MNILMLTTNFPKYKGDYYGSYVFDNTRILARAGHEIQVIAPHFPKTNFNEILDKVKIKRFRWLEPLVFTPLMYMGKKDVFRLFSLVVAAFISAARYLKKNKNKVDLVDAQNVLPMGLIAVLLGRIFRKPVLVTPQGVDLRNYYLHPLWSSLVSYTLKRSTKIVAISYEMFEAILQLGIPHHKVHLLPNAIDTKQFVPHKITAKNSKFNIGFLGSLIEHKGPHLFVGSLKYLKNEIPNLKIHFTGDGPLKDRLNNQLKDLNKEKIISWHGQIDHPEVVKFLNQMDVMVFASPYENLFSVALLESMACGKPVVATDVGFTSHLVKPEQTGLLTKPNPKSLATSILKLYHNPLLRKSCGQTARELIVAEYSLKNRAKKLATIYKQLLEEGRK